MPSSGDRSPSAPRAARYEFLKELERGGFGVSWLARVATGPEAGRLVVVRRTPMDELETHTRRRLELRGESYLRVRHPSMAKLLRVAVLEREVLIESEFVEGVPLTQLMRLAMESETPVAPTVAVKLVLDIATAVVSARRVAIDVGVELPRRLLFVEGVQCASYGEALLAEVGVLGELATSSAHAGERRALAYLAPEELTPQESSRGVHEVFTLGVLLWELLANRSLFLGESAEATRSATLRRAIPPLETAERLGLPVPQPLVDIVHRALERDPERRYRSVEEFVGVMGQLPARLIASEDQVRAFLAQMLGGYFQQCRISGGLPLHDPVSGVGVNRRSTQAPPRESGPWEAPTLPGHRLVSVSESLEAPKGPNLGLPQGAARGAAEEVVASSVAPVRNRPPGRARGRWGVAWLAALGVAVAIAAGVLLARAPGEPTPVAAAREASAQPFATAAAAREATAQPPATAAAARGVSAPPLASAVPALVASAEVEPGATQAARATVAEPSSDPSELGDEPAKNEASAPRAAPASAATDEAPTPPKVPGKTFHPTSISPYRPQGI